MIQTVPAYDDVIKGKHFPCYWPFVQGIHRSPVNSPYKGHWRGALKFSLICAWIDGSVNNPKAGNLRPHRAHYYVTVIQNGDDISPHNDQVTSTNKSFLPWWVPWWWWSSCYKPPRTCPSNPVYSTTGHPSQSTTPTDTHDTRNTWK